MSSSTHVRIDLTPKPGFCVKSSTLTPGVLPAPPPSKTPNANLLEPVQGPTPIPKGLKVFVNIAWDPNVPPPPEGSEEAIQRAMQGEDVDEANPSGWYVPVIVSNGRQDKDKAGNPSLVFDCIYNTTVKSRTLRDPEFKIFLIELALQRIEDQTGLSLSRNIATPNISSKGKLLPRSVHIPAALVPALIGAPSSRNAPGSEIPSIDIGSASGASNRKSPLIQEIRSASGSSPALTPEANGSTPRGASSIESPSTSSGTGASASRPKRSAGGGSLPGLRGILKTPSATAAASSSSTRASTSASTPTSKSTPVPTSASAPGSQPTRVSDHVQDQDIPLDWSWSKDDSGRLRIEVRVPGLTHALIRDSTLDVEPRRFTLSVPHHATLDVDLALSDAEIVSRIASSPSSSSLTTTSSTTTASLASSGARTHTSPTALAKSASADREKRKQEATTRALELKRQRDFDVDAAQAEWRVGSGEVVIYV